MINNNIKLIREELELTQSELGKYFNVSKGTVSNWENGYGIMPLEKLIKLSNYSGFSLDYICGLSKKNIKYKEIDNINCIGNNLKKFRKEKNLSQEKFSKKCNIPQSTYSHYEIGYKLITSINLYTICKTYNISMDNLLERKKRSF